MMGLEDGQEGRGPEDVAAPATGPYERWILYRAELDAARGELGEGELEAYLERVTQRRIEASRGILRDMAEEHARHLLAEGKRTVASLLKDPELARYLAGGTAAPPARMLDELIEAYDSGANSTWREHGKVIRTLRLMREAGSEDELVASVVEDIKGSPNAERHRGYLLNERALASLPRDVHGDGLDLELSYYTHVMDDERWRAAGHEERERALGVDWDPYTEGVQYDLELRVDLAGRDHSAIIADVFGGFAVTHLRGRIGDRPYDGSPCSTIDRERGQVYQALMEVKGAEGLDDGFDGYARRVADHVEVHDVSLSSQELDHRTLKPAVTVSYSEESGTLVMTVRDLGPERYGVVDRLLSRLRAGGEVSVYGAA